MKKKYKFGLKTVGFLLIIALVNVFLYLDFKKNYDPRTSSIVVVNNVLSVNYEYGQNLKVKKDDEVSRFSITNNSSDKIYYYIAISSVQSNNSNFKFDLHESSGKINIKQDNFPAQDAYLVSFVEIEPNTTHNYEINLYKENNLNFKAKLVVGVEDEVEEYFASTILKNNSLKFPTTKIAIEAATSDEGLIETNDDFGSSYYFRGNVQNNYVSLGNNLWRIVKINGDGTVKLVLDDYLELSQYMYDSTSSLNLSEKLEFINTKVYNYLNEFYENNLLEYDKIISNHKFCIEDNETTYDEKTKTTYYQGYARATQDFNPLYNCFGSLFSHKIGLLTIDEILLAGASKDTDNKDFYLYTPDETYGFWSLTPSSSTDSDVSYFSLSNTGKLIYTDVGSSYRGVKPVINLIKKVMVNGDGTKTNPYTIKES